MADDFNIHRELWRWNEANAVTKGPTWMLKIYPRGSTILLFISMFIIKSLYSILTAIILQYVIWRKTQVRVK